MIRRVRLELGAALLAAPVVWAGVALLHPEAIHVGAILARGWQFLLLAGLYPAAEEVVFRGVIQGWMLDRPWGARRLGPVSRANIATSLLFAALHLPAHPVLMAALVFPPSLVFGHFRERTGKLLCPVLLHCWYNAGWFLLFGLP